MPAEITKEELLEAIQENGPRKVVQQYRHNLLPSRVLIDLYSEHPERDVLLFLSLYPTVPSQILEDLGEACVDPEIQAAIAVNPRCTHLLLVRMAREGGPAVRAALAANKLQNSKLTAGLLNDPNLQVRTALAGNATIAASYRTALATDPEPAVRCALAGTAKLPPELIHMLSADDSAVVRANLFAHGKVDADILLGWAYSDDIATQRLMLNRSKPAAELLKALSLSPDAAVQQAIKPRYEPDAPELLARAESDDEAQRLETAQYKKLPAEIQHVLAADPQSEVRAALAGNPSIDEEVALCIAASNDPIACTALARNPTLPDQVKVELCHHESDEVRIQMTYRDDLNEELLDILVNQHEDLNVVGHLALRGRVYGGTHADLLDRLLRHKRPSLRTFAAAAEQLTSPQVRKLMRDDAAPVRLALCGNPILTRAALQELTKDWNAEVAAEAQTQLENRPEHDAAEDENFEHEEGSEPSLVSRIVRFFTD